MTPKPVLVALIDDDKIFRLTASKTMEATFLTENVLLFESGEDALVFLQENSTNNELLPDYIFLDINMPYMDGWMFLEEYKKLKPKLSKNIVVYMLSSSIEQRDLKRTKENEDVEDYILKPISKEKFTALITQQ
jgi:CheY-like chemotaxis protein